MKIAALADIHLGKRSGPGIDWARRAVDRAVADGAELLVLAGDLINRKNSVNTSDDPLELGEQLLRHAAATGVTVLNIWGNHDVSAGAPEKIPAIPGVCTAPSTHVLDLQINGLTVHAISAAADPDLRRFADLRFPVARPGCGPHLGVLHTSVTGEFSNKPCLPATRAELESRAYDRWILGHVHKPHRLSERISWVGMGELTIITLSTSATDSTAVIRQAG